MNARVPSWIAVAVVSSAVACGSSSSNGKSSVTVDQACADIAQARCHLRSDCSVPEGETGLGFNVLENYGDLDTCLAREALGCQNGLAAPQNGNSPNNVE
jgi:hypothetical protein